MVQHSQGIHVVITTTQCKDTLNKLLSIRFSLRRQTTVLYKSPGFLHGTYMLQKRGPISNADLRKHALDMRYGVGHRSLRNAVELNSIYIEIISVE